MSKKAQNTPCIVVFLMIGLALTTTRLHTTEAFVASTVNIVRCSRSWETYAVPYVHPLHSRFDDYNEESDVEIEEIILALSKEQDDDARRERLKKMFDEKIQSDKNQAAQFSSKFNQVLIAVGDRMKLQAVSEAQHAKQNDRDSEEQQQKADRSDTELQLWALVDMMVQSKTIIKKALG